MDVSLRLESAKTILLKQKGVKHLIRYPTLRGDSSSNIYFIGGEPY